jgi:hypothetical protein
VKKHRDALELDIKAGKIRVGEKVHPRSWVFGTDKDGQPGCFRGESAAPLFDKAIGDTVALPGQNGAPDDTFTITEIFEEAGERLTSSGVTSILTGTKLRKMRKHGKRR